MQQSSKRIKISSKDDFSTLFQYILYISDFLTTATMRHSSIEDMSGDIKKECTPPCDEMHSMSDFSVLH